mmetsp:Transcript_39318/g.97137  ORF Transcript_39318/g.97137 Transcript_39318/m.97137 type:complete len:719 (-) Transcript_39318:205-2361(-)
MHDDANLGLDLGLLKGIGGVRLPEERVLDVPPRLDALDDSDGALEELGQRAMSQEYDPQAFASLRRLQILDHHRNGSISDRASLSVCNVTWNVAGLAPTPASVLEALGPSPAVLPDLVIFGVQEAVELSSREVLLTDNSASVLWRGLLESALVSWGEASDGKGSSSPKRGSVELAPARPSPPVFAFKRSSSQPSLRGMSVRGMELQAERCPYVLVGSTQLVGIILTVWARRDHSAHCAEVRSATIGTGALGFLGNKGAAAIRLRCYHTSLVFVCVHLNANKSAPEARNTEYKTIEAKLAFTVPRSTALTLTSSLSAVRDAPKGAREITLRLRHHDVVVWLGDLNYRLALPTAEVTVANVRTLIQHGNLRPLLAADQLQAAQRAGKAFEGYSEAPITFSPTYKYDWNSTAYDSSDKKRSPAWTDRVLWLETTPPGELHRVTPVDYGRREVLTSDHRPVFATLKVAISVESADKKAKLHKALDQWELSRIPTVSIHPRELKFGFLQPAVAHAVSAHAVFNVAVAEKTLSVRLTNLGQTIAFFSFRTKPGRTSPFPDWLTVTPEAGSLNPGASLSVSFCAGSSSPLSEPDPVSTPSFVPSSQLSGHALPRLPSPPALGKSSSGGGFSYLRRSSTGKVQTAAALASLAVGTKLSSLLAPGNSPPPKGDGPNNGKDNGPPKLHPDAMEEVLVLTLENGGDYFLPVSVTFLRPDYYTVMSDFRC